MADPDIWIVGLGIKNVDHVTRETERVLRRCNEVLYVDGGLATQAHLEGLCGRVTPLFGESYRHDEARLDAYANMAARVIDAALRHPPVAFALTGHPLVFSYPPVLVGQMAEALGLEVRVLPGISAIDCLVAELGFDPCEDGLQMYEATDLLARRRPLQPDVPAFVWQVGNVETRLHTTATNRPERFYRLRDHLLRFYPPEHLVTAVYSSPYPLVPSIHLRFALGALADQAPSIHVGYTLYLPKVGTRPVEDIDLVRQMDDPEHLRRITTR